ncbi:GGDEF domain-containing protein [Mycobacterium sp.]|uniref:GGDEF domain-containing protein n=1 Tax=Mycobacterium sp. TaxID=1785 RepID=UPI002600A16C|nr:GGDEF domain-containing protein [Mycobacterium sp.]
MRTKRWQRSADHYEWFSGYLQAHGMITATRALMGFVTGAMVLCLLALLGSPSDGPVHPVAVTMTWIAVGGGVLGTALWAWRWPNRAQSTAYGVVTIAAIALACAAYPNPLAALLGCIAFATSGAYVAFFLPAPLVLINFVVATAVAIFQAVRLAHAGHLSLAGVDLWLVLQINISMPLAIQILVRALGDDLVNADLDPLTGLLNRRAFHHKTLGLLLSRRPDTYLLVALVDLDRFKMLNDKYGHPAGDQALIEVANALRAATAHSAVIARSGGEEFLIADTVQSPHHPPALARQICDSIAMLPARITASVGTVCAAMDGRAEHTYRALLDHLIGAADAAMYHAKRNGGNQSHHQGLCDHDQRG